MQLGISCSRSFWFGCPAQVQLHARGHWQTSFSPSLSFHFLVAVFTPLSAVVLEGHKVLSAFRPSALLTQGHRLAIRLLVDYQRWAYVFLHYWRQASFGRLFFSSGVVLPSAVRTIMTMIVIFMLPIWFSALAIRRFGRQLAFTPGCWRWKQAATRGNKPSTSPPRGSGARPWPRPSPPDRPRAGQRGRLQSR